MLDAPAGEPLDHSRIPVREELAPAGIKGRDRGFVFLVKREVVEGEVFAHALGPDGLGKDNGAEGDSYTLAAYATYLADNGVFVDVIGRVGHLKNDVTAGNMAVDTSSMAYSLSVESGHQFRFIEDRAYVEPQVELTYGFMSGDDATASNGVYLDQDDYQSLVTRVGVRAGFDFPEKAGTIYAMVSYSYDFLGDADAVASQGGVSENLTESLGGGWVSYGIGAQVKLGDSAFAYGELERTSGGDVVNPYLFNCGVRWVF